MPSMYLVDDEGGPPLSNKDMKNSVILTELPFVVPFQERVKVNFIEMSVSKFVPDNKSSDGSILNRLHIS